MPASERSITESIRRFLRRRGWWYYKVHGGRFGQAGVPDVVAVGKGRTIWLEVKTQTGRCTPRQLTTQAEMRRAGAEVYVVRSAHEVRQIIDGETQ
jgi:Holliday junction resolvase